MYCLQLKFSEDKFEKKFDRLTLVTLPPPPTPWLLDFSQNFFVLNTSAIIYRRIGPVTPDSWHPPSPGV